MYGKEYFEGNLLEMLTIILQQVSLSFNCLSSSIDYCKKLQQYENNNNALNAEVVKLQQENDFLKEDKNISKQKDHKENTEIEVNNEITNVTDNIKDDANLQCKKCNKSFSRLQRLRQHESNCDGFDPKQCKICLKVFATRQGKYEHNKFVKCNPPSSQLTVSTPI
tara:strand:+ start:4051 stop:4548 length:498 start_codon:yes stop_codon:yes gene_type:complete